MAGRSRSNVHASRFLLSAALLAPYAMAVAWVFDQQSMARPREGSRRYVVFYLFCPGIVFPSILAYLISLVPF